MDTFNIALVSVAAAVGIDEVAKVAGAVQRQVNDHLAQYWHVRASVSAYANPSDVPVGYWRVTVEPGGPGDPGGIHRDLNGQPYAKVFIKNGDGGDGLGWSVAASHEILEMLVDPTLSAFRPGFIGPKRVNFLVEICDPCQADAYSVNGIAVSDFVTPAYFDPNPVPGGRYSYNGSILKPRSVAPGGLIVWSDPQDGGAFYAYINNGSASVTRRLGNFPGGFMAPREWIDAELKGMEVKLATSAQAQQRRLRKRLQAQQAAHDVAAKAAASLWTAAAEAAVRQGRALEPHSRDAAASDASTAGRQMSRRRSATSTGAQRSTVRNA